MAPYKIIKQGYMLKEPPMSKRGMRKKLRRFWFVLLEDKKQVALVYYKNEDAYIKRQRNVGFIRIDNSRVNVIGEYMTHKNAFEIVTEKSVYVFVPETRYELHDWIFTLHNTLECFHHRIERVRVRLEQRQRALSGSSAASDGGHTHSSPTTPSTVNPPQASESPLTTPNHVPKSPGSAGSRSRKPSRPAPLAPGRANVLPQVNGSGHTPNHTPSYTYHEFPHQYSHSFEPPHASEMYSQSFEPPHASDMYSHEGPASLSMSQATTSPCSTMDSRQHPVLDLDITQTEESHREEGEGEEEGAGEGEERLLQEMQREIRTEQSFEPVVRPPPVHQRSISDTSILLCRSRINSTSLPELGEESSASPEPVADTVEGARRQIAEDMPKKQYRTKHTRHLSLLTGRSGKCKRGSLKNRSRSPPNYPPPPPPANEDSGNEACGGVTITSNTELGKDGRKHSLGFSNVMKTISSIDQELQEMGGVGGADVTPNISPPMRFRADTDDLDLSPPQDPLEGGVGDEGGVGGGRDEGGVGGGRDEGGGREGEGLDTSGPSLNMATAVGEVDGEMEGDIIEKNLSPIHFQDKEVTTRIFFSEATTEQASAEDDVPPSPAQSPTKRTPPPVAAKPKLKPKKNKVMFKEEVEDIPSYEPRIDNEGAPASAGDQDIPSSVAELKKMLFGQPETQKYSKDGPMSPRFGAIVDTDGYDEDLHKMLTPTQHHGTFFPDEQQQSSHYQHLQGFTATVDTEREDSPQDGGLSPTPQRVPDEGQENEYDAPWDSKPISKYSVVGHRKQALSPAQRAQQFEVVTHTTATPGNMERRNVNSLERQLRTDTSSTSLPEQLHFSSSPTQDSDLLQSISSTLQTRSKYGSDTLLNMGQPQSFSQGDVPVNYHKPGHGKTQQGNEVRRSARSDLERIRTQHRGRSVTTAGHAHPSYHGSNLQPKKPLSQSHQSVNHDGKRGGAGGRRAFAQQKGTWKAHSVDGLQVDPATLVTYDTYTRSHTLQSLV